MATITNTFTKDSITVTNTFDVAARGPVGPTGPVGVTALSSLTTVGYSSPNMLRVAAAGGVEQRTPAQVLTDIAALPASGNAVSATKLQTARTIAGKSFDGTANVSIAAADVNAVARTGDEAVAGKKTFSSKAVFNGPATSDSSLQIGPVECQGFSINNSWVGENIFYNGASYERRSTGFTENVCFFNGEVQIRNANTGPAGSNPLDLSQFKASYNGAVAIGGSMNSASADYFGCGLLVTATNVKSNFPFQVTSAAPATATSAGVAGTITYSAGFVYVCVATNIWQRAALITF